MTRRGTTVERVTLTLPADLVAALRELAPTQGMSCFVAEAVSERLARARLDEALTAGFAAWETNDDPELATSRAVSRHTHDRRRQDDEQRRRLPVP